MALVAIDPHTGRGEGAGRRAQLWHEPAQPCARQAPAGIDFQAVRVCRGDGYRGRRRPAHSDPEHHHHGPADHLLVRRQALRAQQLRAQVLWRCDAPHGACEIAERGHGESGGDGGVRQRGRDGEPRRHELQDPADAGGGARRVRDYAARSCRRVHGLCQWRRLREAELPAHGARRATARSSTRTRTRTSRRSIRASRT